MPAPGTGRGRPCRTHLPPYLALHVPFSFTSPVPRQDYKLILATNRLAAEIMTVHTNTRSVPIYHQPANYQRFHRVGCVWAPSLVAMDNGAVARRAMLGVSCSMGNQGDVRTGPWLALVPALHPVRQAHAPRLGLHIAWTAAV